MTKLYIDDQQVRVPEGSTILEAAEAVGIAIPTLCFLQPYEASTSCMVCSVRLVGTGAIVPACGCVVEEGMAVDTKSETVIKARRSALELLLSDHLGDCVAPCRRACPAGMDIPKMISCIAAGENDRALKAVLQDIALPAVLGRICDAPCEKACRRAQIDEPVSICHLKRFVADCGLKAEPSWLPESKGASGEKVAVVGAGPAGLAAAFYLRRNGYSATVFDENDEPGGMLRYGIGAEILLSEALEADVRRIISTGIEFVNSTRVSEDIPFEGLQNDYDAVFIAVGCASDGKDSLFGLPVSKKVLEVKKYTYETAIPGVFAGGDIVRNRRSTVRSAADGKEAAAVIDRYLSGRPLAGRARRFNSRFGRLKCGEQDPAVFGAVNEGKRAEVINGSGLTPDQALKESQRCLHCECLKADDCKLRDLCEQYDVRAGRYREPASPRELFVRNAENDVIVYEPGKCISCGLCVQIAEEAGEEVGLGFIGRGFHVRVEPPFGRTMDVALRACAEKCASCCPTGAMAIKGKVSI